MQHLHKRKRALIRGENKEPGLVDREDRYVQQHLATVDSASKDQVRRPSQQLVPPEDTTTVVGRNENPRWSFYVHLDMDALNSVVCSLYLARVGKGPMSAKTARPAAGYIRTPVASTDRTASRIRSEWETFMMRRKRSREADL